MKKVIIITAAALLLAAAGIGLKTAPFMKRH